MGRAIELGRSFVRAEYQRGFQPLLLLWNGIGAFVSRNPRYRVLFGPVSISNRYQALSRQLIVSFLERHAFWAELKNLVAARNPFRGPTERNTGLDVDDLSAVVSDVDPGQSGIPLLLRHYLRLGGKLVGFNVDPQFADVLDGLIVVDLTKTDPSSSADISARRKDEGRSRSDHLAGGIFRAPRGIFERGKHTWRTEKVSRF